MKSGIYGIYNMANNKWYIGQSINLKMRQRDHFYNLCRGKGHNKYLQRAFVKYGENSFKFRILEKIKEDSLDIQERFWITYYKSNQPKFGYNLEDGGNKNKHLSEKTRKKISESHKGHINSQESIQKRLMTIRAKGGFHCSAETRKKIGKASRGRIHSVATRQKLSKIHMGTHHSIETRLKMSKTRKGHSTSLETRRKISEAHKGKKFSAEHIQKLSEAHMGITMPPFSDEHRRKISEAKKGNKNPNYGKHFSKEHRKKMSKTMKKYRRRLYKLADRGR